MPERFQPNQAGSQEAIPHRYRITVSLAEDRGGGEIETLAAELQATPVYYSQADEDSPEFRGPGYVRVSSVDSKNKESIGYGPCIGIAAIGTEKESGANISLLSHVTVPSVQQQDVTQELTAALENLKSASVPGSIDVVVIGGNVFNTKSVFGRKVVHDDIYKTALAHLAEVVRSGLEVEPRVFGPNENGITSVILDTQHRRLHMRRSPGQAFGDFDKPAAQALE